MLPSPSPSSSRWRRSNAAGRASSSASHLLIQNSVPWKRAARVVPKSASAFLPTSEAIRKNCGRSISALRPQGALRALANPFSAAGGEEVLDYFGALGGQHTRGNFHLMVEFGVRQHLEAGTDGAALYIVAAVHHARDARLDDGAGAHAAWLDRDVERRACKAIVADGA